MNVPAYLKAALWAGGVLTLVLLVSALLWLTLTVLGDQAGGQGAKGVAMVAIVCLVLDLIALVVLLALAEIRRSNESTDELGGLGQRKD